MLNILLQYIENNRNYKSHAKDNDNVTCIHIGLYVGRE